MNNSAQAATVSAAKQLTRAIIKNLEGALGAERALPATKHAAALYDSLAEIERQAAKAKERV